MMKEERITYKKAGVDVERGERFARWIGQKMASFQVPEVISRMGASASLYSLDKSKYQDPVLVATTDGVGTKLKIAQRLGKHTTVGIDLVAMCINDLLTQRAKPLFFLDYLATGKLDLKIGKEIILGIQEGCRRAGCLLIGGETAEMPSFYGEEEYDIVGFAVGIVEKRNLIEPSKIRVGDKILGLPSSGLHSNGFSLVRKVLFETGRGSLTGPIQNLRRGLEEELLEPTRIYTHPILDLLRDFPIKGIAHITGGGMVRNIPRVLPRGSRARLYKGSWRIPPIFTLIQERGGIEEEEMFRVFNMGIGMALIIPAQKENSILKALTSQGEKAWTVGEIVRGEAGVDIK
jgi:phosphoribosylformylglycinamidine cyclo-ligase